MLSHKKTLVLFGLISSVTAIGVFGYQKIEGWSFFDAVYMTMITITTTGYQEVHPMSPDGRMFTMLLLIMGVGTVAFSASYFIQDILSYDYKTRRRLKMRKKIAELSQHVVLCGYGRMGKVIAKELTRSGIEFVIIERSGDHTKDLENSKYLWIEGDATSDETLMKSGITQAKTLLCMVDSDSDSLYISLACRALNENLYIVSRAIEESARIKILRAGADKVILPVVVSGLKVAQVVLTPEVDDLLDIDGMALSDNERFQVAEIRITQSHNLLGKNLKNSGLKLNKLIVIGVRHLDGNLSFVPSASYDFQEGDTLLTVSTAENFSKVMTKYAS